MDTDILIIGAGLAGAATAYHLGRRGVTNVVVVDQADTLGAHSSGRNAALVRANVPDADVARLAAAGARVLREGRFAPFHQTGSVLIGKGSDDVSRRFPLARGRGRWCPDDGVVEVAALLDRYLRDVEVRLRTEVRSLEPCVDGIVAETSAGVIKARQVVNAAGAWAARFAAVPLTPMNRHLFITAPRADIDPSWPFVWDDARGLYFRPESGGLLLCPCDEARAAAGDYTECSAVLDRLGSIVSESQPGLGELAIMNQWVGQRTFAADRKFVIGRDPHRLKVFHVAALGGHGVTCSPAVGELAATLLLDGPGMRPNPFDPSRLLQPA